MQLWEEVKSTKRELAYNRCKLKIVEDVCTYTKCDQSMVEDARWMAERQLDL